MDPFTQRMLERAKIRREKLNNHLAEEVKVLKNNTQENKEISSECDTTNDEKFMQEANKQDHGCIRKMKLQKLALFYAGEKDLSLERDKNDVEDAKSSVLPGKAKCKSERLAKLACKINQWEDDTNHPKHHTSSVPHSNYENNSDFMKENEKPNISNSMIKTLCSQGFSENQGKLTYDFNKKKDDIKELCITKNNEGNSHNISQSSILYSCHGNNLEQHKKLRINNILPQNDGIPVSNKVAFFERNNSKELKIQTKDPAELSLAERKALFENNFLANNKSGLPSTRKILSSTNKPDCRVLTKSPNKMQLFGNSVNTDDKIVTKELEILNQTKNKQEMRDKCLEMLSDDLIRKETSTESPKLEKKEEISEKIIKASPTPAVTCTPEANNKQLISNDIFSSGRLYPSLSGLEVDDIGIINAEVNVSPESENSNLCLNMSLADLLELNKNNPITPPKDLSFSKSKEYQVLNKMNKLLENALHDISSEMEDDDYDTCLSPPKILKSSSFEYKSNDSDVPLLHTLSFYRKQQKNNLLSEEKEYQIDVKEDQSTLVENKIQILLAEVSKQQTIMSQASQALNLCMSTVEFSNSGEQVEGERLLLLASHKRQACLNEIQRLKVENRLWNEGENVISERGDVILTNISVKLKRDVHRAMAAAENLQYFLCLIKSDERVLATPVVAATSENLKDYNLLFPGSVKLEGLLSNFRVTIEVYSLKLNKELLPHEVKYHLCNKKDKKLLTPIKIKKNESKLVKPQFQSPAGPNAIRTSSFQMCGYVVFSLKEVNRTQWTLNKVPYVSSLEGTLSMNISSQLHLDIEFRGFLTMFEDISGFGAWHRRWCLLSSHFISFWKYPDDEQKKIPIGTIDLRSVVTENVGLVSRDVCARLNTFLLETERPKLIEDKNSLVLKVQDGITTIRHLLSADSKQEMLIWCKKINTILALLRSWKSNFEGSV